MHGFIARIFLSLTASLTFVCSQHWWNYEQIINPYEAPVFTPLPAERYTHPYEQLKIGPEQDDIVVNVPRAGHGAYIGFSQHINYDFSWTSWPAKKGRRVNAFLGIPYAAPPVGRLRFKAPEPSYLNSRFPWVAKAFKPSCIYDLTNGLPQSEDCLYLNIFTPNPDDIFPVIVHICGDAPGHTLAYQPHAMVSEGIVYVNFNYRRSVFGFLATGDFASIGNYGLLDQVMALKWVRDNIWWFRGDPNKITVMGDELGANHVGLHLVSPVSRSLKLFDQVILMSGSDLSPWAVSSYENVHTRQYAIELGKQLNCPAAMSADSAMAGLVFNSSELDSAFGDEEQLAKFHLRPRGQIIYQRDVDAYSLLYCLRYEKNASEILTAANQVTHLRGAPRPIWTPVVDGASGFLPFTPHKERQYSHFTATPVLAGFTHDWASDLLSRLMLEWDDFNWAQDELTEELKLRTMTRLVHMFNAYHFNETLEELQTRYTWWPNQRNETARREQLVALVSHWLTVAPLYKVVTSQQSLDASVPVYLYEFAYRSPKDPRSKQYGIYRGVERPFLFGYPFMNDSFWRRLRPEGLEDEEGWMRFVNEHYLNVEYSYPHDTNISQFMIKTWTDFAKNPTPVANNNLTWLTFDTVKQRYAHIWINSTMRYRYESALMTFWHERFALVAQILSASLPRYYHPVDQLQQATAVVAALLLLVLILITAMCSCILRKPKPHKFRSDVRFDGPGAHPKTAFHSNFQDAYSNAETMQRLRHPPPPAEPLPTVGSLLMLNTRCSSRLGIYESARARNGAGVADRSPLQDGYATYANYHSQRAYARSSNPYSRRRALNMSSTNLRASMQELSMSRQNSSTFLPAERRPSQEADAGPIISDQVVEL